MTAEQIFYVARRLASQCFVRYWLKWPAPDNEPWLIGLCCVEADGSNSTLYEPDLPEGWAKQTKEDGRLYYVWPRLTETGEPFTSSL